MTWIVSLMGALILVVGAAVIGSPAFMKRVLRRVITRRLIPLFSLARIGIGIVFVLAAPSTRLPAFVWAMGILAIAAGVSLPLLGMPRLKRWTELWIGRPDRVVRGWALVAVLVGLLLLWSAG